MTDSERLQHALDLAFRYLGHRDRTVFEVRERLTAEAIEPAVVDDAVDELHHLGYLDDARYARQFAEDKRELDRWGSERIAQDLRRRGIATQLIDAAVSTHDRDSELRTALLLLRQRYPHAPRDDRERDRAWQMLVRRGYSPDLSYDAIRTWERTERERRRAA